MAEDIVTETVIPGADTPLSLSGFYSCLCSAGHFSREVLSSEDAEDFASAASGREKNLADVRNKGLTMGYEGREWPDSKPMNQLAAGLRRQVFGHGIQRLVVNRKHPFYCNAG